MWLLNEIFIAGSLIFVIILMLLAYTADYLYKGLHDDDDDERED